MNVKITQALLDELTAAAKASLRLRMNLDLRNSPADGSQRMLNALEPGTVLPIHRHRSTSETVVCLRGQLREIFYDNAGQVTEVIDLAPGSDCMALNIPLGQWHSVEVLEGGTVILECKDGAYEPLNESDILKINHMVDNSLVERLKEFMENEARSCSMDFGCITPEYVYRMWGGAVSLEEIEAAMKVVKVVKGERIV